MQRSPTVHIILVSAEPRRAARPRSESGKMITTTHAGDIKRKGCIWAVVRTKGQPPKTIQPPCRARSFSAINLLTIDQCTNNSPPKARMPINQGRASRRCPSLNARAIMTKTKGRGNSLRNSADRPAATDTKRHPRA